MQHILRRFEIGFAGATLGLILAEGVFGATGVRLSEAIALALFLLTTTIRIVHTAAYGTP